MPQMTPAQWEAYWAAIKNPLPGGEAFNGQYWWLTQTSPGVTTATHDPTANTFGAVLEHDNQVTPAVRCSVQIIDPSRPRDPGFNGTNAIQVGGFRDPITCPICGLTGSIRNKAWVPG